MCFRMYADLEANNRTENSSIGYKTTISKQKPVCTGYYIVSETNGVLKSSYFEFPLRYNIMD